MHIKRRARGDSIRGRNTKKIHGTYIDWADKVLIAHEYIRHGEAEENRQDPSADESLDCLLRRKLDQLRTAECDAANISENIVRDDERSRQEEPDHALKDVVHNEMCLDNDQV